VILVQLDIRWFPFRFRRSLSGFVFFLALLVSFSTRAQTYFVDLSGQTITLPERTVYIAKVLDVRPQQANIGWVQRGLVNTPTLAELRNGVEADLTTFLQQQLPQRPTDQALLLRVQQLAISEHTGTFAEKAFAEVAFEYLVLRDDGYHVVLSTAETVESSGAEVTAHHPRNIVQALQNSMALLSKVSWDSIAGTPVFTLEQVRSTQPLLSMPAQDYRILHTTPRAGIYRHFAQFQNNMPDTTTVYVVDRKPRTSANWKGTTEVQPYTVDTKTGQRTTLRNVWGFSDGQQLYVLHNRHFFPLERQADGFKFTGFSAADPNTVNAAAVAGGLIGAGIAAAATSGKPTLYVVNMRTGRIVDNHLAPATVDTTQLVIYRRAGGDKDPLTVLVNEEPVGTLRGASYLTIPLATRQETNVCLRGAANHCLTIKPTTAAMYLECSRQPTDSTVPPLTAVTDKVGEFNVKGIRLRQEQDAKKQAN